MKNRKLIFTLSALMIMSVCLLMVSILEKKEMDEIKKLYSNQIEKRYSVSTMNQTKDAEGEEITENISDVREQNDSKEQTSERKLEKRMFEKYVFVGDSRYRGMAFMADESDVFICENGRGYSFLTEQMSTIRSVCDKNTALIVGLGVNDNINKVEGYINKLNEMAQNMECQIYYMLVNPVDEAKEQYNGYNVRNENIDIFNERMKEGLDENVGIIDTNSYLLQVGYETQDGLHYTDATYEKIYNYIKSEITG